MNPTPETWLPIPGYEGHYAVSDRGRVRSFKKSTPRILKPGIATDGYPIVTLCRDGRASWLIHRLVMLAFVGPLPEGRETRHRDGDPANNVLTNLTYGTGVENQHDRIEHGTDIRSLITHCPQGHRYDAANTIEEKRGSRTCRICKPEKDRADYAAHTEARRAKNRAWKAKNPDYQRAYRAAKRG